MANTLTSIGSSTASSSLASSLAVTGLASGMDWSTLIQALANAERSPEIQWQQQQTTVNSQNAAFGTISSDLTTLQADVKTLQDPSFYDSRAAQTSDSTIATATAASGATIGTYSFNISQLATASQIYNTSKVSQILAPNGNIGNVTIGTAGFSTPVTAGTFTVDGASVTISASDSLQAVFNNISTATQGKVTASYDQTSDTITLTGSGTSQIILGSATDTSNFLQVAQLYNTGAAGPVTSASALGHVQLNATLSNANLLTAITGDSTGAGAFTINGVTINYNTSTDNLNDVLSRITNSAAGVTATYDSLNNRFVLTNKTTGDTGITINDVTGNFLTATGLAGASLQHGKNLLYTINNGSPLVSQSNTITDSSSGITGLSVTALTAQKAVSVTVSSDTSTISSAIQKFITDYNTVQTYITNQTSVTTASDGTVTAGLLTGDQTTNEIASSLRSISSSPVSIPGLTSVVNQLADLGIQSNGQDNTIQLSDTGALNTALTTNLSDVKALFSDSTYGLGIQLNNFINGLIGDNGSLAAHQATLTQRSTDIGTQISNLEKTVTDDSARWATEFQAMEQAQAQVNQELTYLSQQVSNWAKS